jgi:hypothetical protein
MQMFVGEADRGNIRYRDSIKADRGLKAELRRAIAAKTSLFLR